MLVATLEQERQKIYRKGEASGLAKGVEAQRQTLLQFIHWRFQTSEEEQKQVAQQLTQINDLQQLTELSEHFLQATTLGEFTKRIAAYLSSYNPQ